MTEIAVVPDGVATAFTVTGRTAADAPVAVVAVAPVTTGTTTVGATDETGMVARVVPVAEAGTVDTFAEPLVIAAATVG